MRKLTRYQDKLKGAALAEVAVSAMVGALILSVLPAFSTGYVKLWQRETAELGAGEKAVHLVRRMKEDIRNARRVAVSDDGASVTIVLPALTYDSDHDCMVPAIGADGKMVDGDRVRYYLVEAAATGGGSVHREVIHADGASEATKVIVDSIYPRLNPFDPYSGSPAPLFAYDSSLGSVSVTVTALEAAPSAGTFVAADSLPICRNDGGSMVRTQDLHSADGAIRCSKCGAPLDSDIHFDCSQTKLKVRNS